MAATRSETWKRIWENKYQAAEGPVHKLDGFDLLTEAEWRGLVERFCKIMTPISGSDVLEVGCGAGAFLGNIKGARSLSGIDYSSSAVALAKANLPGHFVHAEAAAIPFPAKSFDIIFSFGVLLLFRFDRICGAGASRDGPGYAAGRPHLHLRHQRRA